MIQSIWTKFKKWINLTAPVYSSIFFAVLAVLGGSYVFGLDLGTKAGRIIGVFLAIALYTIAIANHLKKIPSFLYGRFELVIFCILYLFFHVLFVILLVTAFLPGLPEWLTIPNIVLYLMASPAIYFVSKIKPDSSDND